MKTYKLDCVDSTNLFAKRLAREGAAEGTLVTARRQSAGRGRLGRAFFSPEGGLYMSIVLRPRISSSDARLITTAAAVALCRVLERHGDDEYKIKWVNDVYKNGRKVSGILTEAAPGADAFLEWAVLGIGVNLYPSCPVPKELESIVGYMADQKRDVDEDALADEIRQEFFSLYPTLCERGFADEYRSRMFLKGRRVSVLRDGKSIPATAVDTDENLCLVVKYDDGTLETLGAGEVSIRL